MNRISKLHIITTSPQVAAAACHGGADWVQLRLKQVSDSEYEATARELIAICRQYNACVVINDNVHVAVAAGADGVHLGKSDTAPETARKMLGPDAIIGCTANTYDDIVRLAGMPINYIGLGPFRYTRTKQNLSPILGAEGYNTLIGKLKENKITAPPIIGIGGIVIDDVPLLMSTGLYGIAVSGAISNASDIEATTQQFIQSLQLQSTTHE